MSLATYRIYRIGQTRDVFIYRFETKNSDDSLLRRQITKESQSRRTIDSKVINPQFSSCQLQTHRGYEPVVLISDERLQQLQDPFLLPIFENNRDAIIDFCNHQEYFEEVGIDAEEMPELFVDPII